MYYILETKNKIKKKIKRTTIQNIAVKIKTMQSPNYLEYVQDYIQDWSFWFSLLNRRSDLNSHLTIK